jgi:putative glutamine amidotransferase
VFIDPGSGLYTILGEAVCEVNSTHHQAVKKPGADLTVAAFSEDGVVEAIEDKSKRFCIGVQWHPEALIVNDSRWLKLFTALIHAAGERSL